MHIHVEHMNSQDGGHDFNVNCCVFIWKEIKQDKFDQFISPDEGLFERKM